MDLVWLWLHFPVYLGKKKSPRQGLGSNILWKDQGVKEEGSETGDNWKWTFKGVSPRWPLFQKVTRLLDKCLDSYIKHPCFRAGDVAQLVQCLSSMQKVLPSIPNPTENQVWRCILVSTGLGEWRQENQTFMLNYMLSLRPASATFCEPLPLKIIHASE